MKLDLRSLLALLYEFLIYMSSKKDRVESIKLQNART